ncbi:MAG TPA: hypothetical protein VG604_04385, partial [Candidatus Saccharimonadales bacterium]|nr:hypothetical protein [Candidatus Saccharimonadales bacterium]
LGVDPQTTMKALLNAGVRDFRLVSYWNDGEPAKGQYDFSQLDWQFKLAQQYHAKIILTLGLRQPRWPECHKPKWTANESEIQWQPQLQTYMQQVIERYKSSPSLSSYQIENEFFLKGFGNCDGIPGAEDRQRLISEDNLVKELDPAHQIIIGRSNNTLGWPVGKPQPDSFSISIYQRVWDANATHRYLEYPQPSWLYAFIAGWQRIVDHHDMIIGELQAEAWPPHGRDITKTSLDEQNKSMNASRLKDRIGFGKATGMRQIYLWGAEYWYYREVKLHDPSLMQVAQQEFNH